MKQEAGNTARYPSEGELFQKILGPAWQSLHPDIQRRFDKNPLPGKPLYYTGALTELRCSGYGRLLGMGLGMKLVLDVREENLHFTSDGQFWHIGPGRIPLPGLLTPGKTFLCHRNESPERFSIRIEIRHPLSGTSFTQAGVFREVAEPGCSMAKPATSMETPA